MSVIVNNQEATVVVRPTSRYGIEFDEVSVFSTIQTEQELTTDYYVPTNTSMPPHIINFINKSGLTFRPYSEKEISEGTEDILEQAKEGNLEGVGSDAAKLLLRTALVKTPLRLLSQKDNKYVYEIRYDYKLFPDANGRFNFDIVLPFAEMKMKNGSSIDLTVLIPKYATVNREATVGLAENGASIEEVVEELAGSQKSAVTFQYQQDPAFTVCYEYSN